MARILRGFPPGVVGLTPGSRRLLPTYRLTRRFPSVMSAAQSELGGHPACHGGKGITMIEARELTKRYGSTVAVNGLSFDVRPGTVTGFLGPNGSGKSTTMRMIMGLDRADAGQARIGGSRYADLRWPLREVGALLEARGFHPGLPARAHLAALAASNDIPAARVRHGAGPDRAQRRRGQAAWQVLAGDGPAAGHRHRAAWRPAVLILDEPVNGLDPEGIRWIRDLLKSLAAEGRTVFVSSHLISEMALMADRLIVIGGAGCSPTPPSRRCPRPAARWRRRSSR